MLTNSVSTVTKQLSNNADERYEITGRVKGLEEGEKVLAIMLSDPGANYEIRDSCFVKDGIFHLTGIVPDPPRTYILQFLRNNWKGFDIHKYRNIRLIVDKGEKITVACDTNITKVLSRGSIEEYVTEEGSKYDRSLRALLPAWFLYRGSIEALKKDAQKLVDSIGFDGPALSRIFESINTVNRTFGKEVFTDSAEQVDPYYTLACMVINDGVGRVSGHAAFMRDAYNKLTETQKKSYYGKQLAEFARLSVGQAMPEFSLPAADGKLLALKDVVAKSKLTLVNFWGTNSPLLSSYYPELRTMYKLYHNAGLNIIGVSSDDYKDAWEDSLQKEKYPWYNVLDKKGRIVDSVYHEFSINPDKLRNVTNVLIDSTGKIVAWDPSGVELQWYLWKYLVK